MSRPVFQVSKETQGRQRLAELRREMDEIDVPPPGSEVQEPPITASLESLVETRLKEQLSSLEGRELGLAIMNAIKFLAVRSKIPVAFGSELDEGGS